ncbi:MAG: L-asparaginase II [Rhodospirillaceae bacterium]|nr:L-asparaginase II [Rhodospirillaceae bacterium]
MTDHIHSSIRSDSPVIVEVTRGTLVESRHRVHAVVADAAGEIVHAWGEPDREIYPRSAIKPLQAMALIETGTADRWGLNDERIALACASHSASAAHVMAVEAWLSDLGLGEGDLECGPQVPGDEMAANGLIKRGEAPCKLHNNCSGKHSGFLATALHLGEPTAGYIQADHPVQKRLYDVLSEMGGAELSGTGRGVDGCGIPVYGMPLSALARAVAKMAGPDAAKLGPVRTAAVTRIRESMAKHNFMVSGRGRLDVAAMSAGIATAKRTGAPVFATKTGAEGVHTAILPAHAGRPALGIAVKAEDGTKRASDVVMAHLLAWLGAVDADAGKAELAPFLEMPVTNWEGSVIGQVRPEAGWNRAGE